MDPQQAWLDLAYFRRHQHTSDAINVAIGLLAWMERPFAIPPASALREGYNRDSFIRFLRGLLLALDAQEKREWEAECAQEEVGP